MRFMLHSEGFLPAQHHQLHVATDLAREQLVDLKPGSGPAADLPSIGQQAVVRE